jgi:hypothetical protein
VTPNHHGPLWQPCAETDAVPAISRGFVSGPITLPTIEKPCPWKSKRLLRPTSMFAFSALPRREHRFANLKF